MSHKETTGSIGHLDAGGSPKDNLPKLAEQARQAYEQKRTKDCLDLTRTILLIDPDNTAAHWMRSSIQSEIHRDLENARALLREAQSKENTANHSESDEPSVSELALPKIIPAPAARLDRWQSLRRLVLAGVLIAAGLVVADSLRLRFRPNSVEPPRMATTTHLPMLVDGVHSGAPISLLPAASEDPFRPYTPQLTPVAEGIPLLVHPAPSLDPRPAVSGPPVVDPVAPRETDPSLASPAPRPAKLADPPSVPRANGMLAVSSPASIDIYKDDTYIGSAPVSLELPPGLQTLEYRHGSLSRKVTHQINSNETTRATIMFEVDVQINSRPWAEVFVDGVERKALGQTPLSGVRVPIGSVLVFENPRFPKKKYRVTGNETGIQVVFP
jgi:hypothetical protein